MSDDQSYFQRRASDELSAVRRATCPQAAQAHLELADRYLSKIEIGPVTHRFRPFDQTR